MKSQAMKVVRESRFSDVWFIVNEKGMHLLTPAGNIRKFKSKERAELVLAKRARMIERTKGTDERSRINKRKAAARKAGKNRYEGSACRNCKGTVRYLCNNMCVACLAEHNKRYAAERK